MKRMIIAAVLLLILLPAVYAFAADKREGDWYYEVKNRYSSDPWVQLKDYNPDGDPPEILTVPEKLGGYPVRELAGYVFKDYRKTEDGESVKMKSPVTVILPAGLRNIERGSISFEDLQEIRIENGEYYETVDGVLFARGTHTLKVYPGGKPGVTYTVPEGTEIIDTDAFHFPRYLKEVIAADSVRTIRTGAFSVHGLRLVIPENVREIKPGAVNFAAEFVSASSRYQVINGLLIDTEKKTLLCVPYGTGKYEEMETRIIEIPEGVERIGERAFNQISCRELRLPSTLKTIDNNNNISWIYSGVLELPEGLEYIGNRFSPRQLSKIVFPKSLKTIGEYCFSYSSTLQSVVFREGITSVGVQSFSNNKNLTKVFMPASLRSFGEAAYSSMFYAFNDCPNLQAFVLPETIAEGFCKRREIPYEYLFTGLWQADGPEAAEILSLPGAENIQIRMYRDSLVLFWDQDGTEHQETFRIRWEGNRLKMDGGYMTCSTADGESLTLEMSNTTLHLTRAEEKP